MKEDNAKLNELKRELYNVLSSLDFLYVTSLFLGKNVRTIEEIEIKQNTKLSKLVEEVPRHKVSELIFNFSSHVLTSSQESILMKGLNYFLNFELLFRSMNQDNLCAESDIDHFKSELRNLTYTSFKSYNSKKKKLENITEEEHKALNELASLDNVIIQKADKGNVIVLLDRSTYVEKMENIISDNSKFTPISFTGENDDLKHVLEKEQEIRKFLGKLGGVISADEKTKMWPTGSVPGILY